MPAIWNVGNINGYNNKKISSKLTFEEGETFKGRIVGKGEDEGVIIKLIDGWQFSADLLDESGVNEQQLVKFKVEGFEDGKIKLKIINDSQVENEIVEEDIINEFINKEGLSKEDFSILKGMTKFNIPLSKENIEFVKSIFNLSEKLSDEMQINEFINNYISGKGIDFESLEAVSIRNTLNEFFSAFETMNQDDILLFLENNIDINTENIESYNKLFKGDITIKEFFDNVAKEFESLNLDKNSAAVKDNINADVNPKEIENNQASRYSQKQNIGFKVYGDTVSAKNSVSILNLLKTINSKENNLTKDAVKNILISNKSLFKGAELKQAFFKLDKMNEQELQRVFNEFAGDKGITKENLEETLKQMFGKDGIKLSDTEVAKIKDILNLNSNDNKDIKSTGQLFTNGKNIFDEQGEVQNQKQTIAESNIQEKQNLSEPGKLTSSAIVKNEFEGKINNMKDVVSRLLLHSDELVGKTLEGKVAEFIKSNLNDFKLFNALSNEYYYLDVPISRQNNDYPCKLIIKDDRKGNKQIDSSNVKMVIAVKTINMGTVDAYIKVLDNSLNIDIKCIDKYIKLLSEGTNKLVEKLSDLGYLVNVNVEEKVDEVSLTTCRQFFDSGSNSALDIKV